MRIEYTNGWYEGDVNSAGEFHGYGELHQGSSVYKGNFCNGRFDGYGELVTSRGEKYYGHFINDKMCGKGHLICSDYEYEGDFANGQPDGQGTLKTSTFRYTGQLSRGSIDGYGELVFTNGDCQKGFFKDGIPHGRCTVKNSDGEFAGEWTNGKMNGSFVIRYSDGGGYNGNVVNDKYSGYGKLTWASGDEYEGCFDDGRPHGKGRLTKRDGEVIEGVFTHGVAPEGRVETPAVTEKPVTSTSGTPYSAPRRAYKRSEPDVSGLDSTSRFYEDAKKLRKDAAEVRNYHPIYLAGLERARAEVRKEGGNTYEFCTWGYMIGKWRGMSYTGEKSGTLPYGYGFLSGRGYSYHGYFVNGDKSGYGTENVDGTHYAGYFEGDKRNGYFEHTVDGKIYKLKFKDGVRDTSYIECYVMRDERESVLFRGRCNYIGGKYIYVEGELYEGDACYKGSFKDGRLDGEVIKYLSESEHHTLIYKDGSLLYDLADILEIRRDNYRYVGMLKDGMRSGFGECFYDDGGYYKGAWLDDCWHGAGYVKHADGSTYEGNFEKYQMHGKGKHTDVNGNVYEGEFHGGSRHGRGKETKVDRTSYNGEWQHGKRHGIGKQTEPDGSTYEGQFADDRYNGRGVMKYASGDVYDGEWVDGSWHGNCSISWKASGIRFEGHLDKNAATTRGKFTYPDGSTFEGSCEGYWTWHGKGKYIDVYGYAYEGEWIHGKKSGPFKCYSSRNLSRKDNYSICEYKDDEPVYYSKIKDGSHIYDGYFVYHRGEPIGYGAIMNGYHSVEFKGWILRGEKFRGVSSMESGYYDGEWLGYRREGVGVLVDEGGQAFKSKFKNDSPSLVKERLTYYPSFDGLLREDRNNLSWLKKDAQSGSRNSALMLGIIYEYGYFFGERDDAEAFRWYKLAADADHPLACEGLAKCYYHGRGCVQNYKRAFALFEQASGANTVCRESALYLARCYRYGLGVKQSNENAKHYYASARAYMSDGDREEELKFLASLRG